MGFHFIKYDTAIDFLGMRKKAYAFVILLLVGGLVALFMRGGLQYGIDFSGGVMVHIAFSEKVEDESLKDSFEAQPNLFSGLTIQSLGKEGQEYLFRMPVSAIDTAQIKKNIDTVLKKNFSSVTYEIKRDETVGPKVGADLRNKALDAMFYSVLLIAIYISGRFEQRWMTAVIMAVVLGGGMYGMSILDIGKLWLPLLVMPIVLIICWRLRLNFALSAIVGLIHDVVVTMALLVMLNIEFDLNILAALLTLAGYSLNDTIIVFDRIREVMRENPELSFYEVINKSINQTLSRTILTGGTTLMVLVALFFLGGSVLHNFALTLLLGIIVGTFSSIFISSPILCKLGKPEIQGGPIGVGMEGAV